MLSDSPSYQIRTTLFPAVRDAYRALDLCMWVLKEDELKKDPQGFNLIDDLCKKMKEKDQRFGYLNRNHIIEIFLRDDSHKILISGVDLIKYKNVKYVKPPSALYFGTVENLIGVMKKNGFRSQTKGYVRLFESPENACEFSKRFARVGERVIAIKVDADKAFSDGLKFSTFKDGEYIVAQVQSWYIL